LRPPPLSHTLTWLSAHFLPAPGRVDCDAFVAFGDTVSCNTDVTFPVATPSTTPGYACEQGCSPHKHSSITFVGFRRLDVDHCFPSPPIPPADGSPPPPLDVFLYAHLGTPAFEVRCLELPQGTASLLSPLPRDDYRGGTSGCNRFTGKVAFTTVFATTYSFVVREALHCLAGVLHALLASSPCHTPCHRR
jgi:hypothetical protein